MWFKHNLNDVYRNSFQIEFNFTPFHVTDFKTESENVCKELYDTYGNNLYLSFSGGSDSEYILKTFNRLDIPITPVIVSCPYNKTDIQTGLDYCKQNGIVPEIINFGEEYMDLCKRKTHDRGLFSLIGGAPLFVYDAVSESGGKVITGQGEPLPITNRNGNTDINTYMEFYEFEFYMDTYAQNQPAPFYCFNQKIFYTYINELDMSSTLDVAKCKLYDIPMRNKTYWDKEIYEEIRKFLHGKSKSIKKVFQYQDMLKTMNKYKAT